MKVKFWGCRGSIPVPDSRMIRYGGNTSCVEFDLDGRTFIIDAGTGIRQLGEDLTRRNVQSIDIFITHSHWDHIQGFPFFAPIYSEHSNINIYGFSSSYRQLKDILAHQMSYEVFPISFFDLNSKINFINANSLEYEINGYTIRTIKLNHPVFTIGLRIEKGPFSFAFLTDNELYQDQPTTSFDEFVAFCHNATYLVHDAQFTEEEYTKRQGWGHSTFDQALRLAKEAQVKNLGFFHHDPNRKDEELDILEKKFKDQCAAEGCDFDVFAVRELDSIDLTGTP